MVAAALDLHDVIERELKCKVAMDKSAVVGSTDGLAQKVARRLGCMGVVPKSAATNLGVDFSAGKSRWKTRAAPLKRKKRFANGLARMIRLRKIRKAIGGKKAAIVVAVGAVAVTELGSAVNGISDQE